MKTNYRFVTTITVLVISGAGFAAITPRPSSSSETTSRTVTQVVVATPTTDALTPRDPGDPQVSDGADNGDFARRLRVTSVDESLFDPTIVDEARGPRIRRYRGVTIDSEQLRVTFRETAANASIPIELELFPDVVIQALPTKTEEHVDGIYTGISSWIGYVVGDESSSVILTLPPDGGLLGTIRARQGLYKILPSEQLPYQVVLEIDRSIPITREMISEELQGVGLR